jgi:periplasmic divalent cation tolerance protein
MAGELVVLITAPSGGKARGIGRKLVEERLAACVNVIPRVESVFIWKGRLCREREALMVVKTTGGRFRRLEARVKKLHPYTVPEIIAIPIRKGSADYLKWVREMTR